MAQVVATAGARPTDRRRPPFGLIAVMIAVTVLTALVFTLQPQIIDPSADGCLIVIVGAPLLALAYFLDRAVRRRQTSEVRDARRSGISIGTSRLQRELASLTDLGEVGRAGAASTTGAASTAGTTGAAGTANGVGTANDPGRHLGALNQEV